jgi:molecular chaperone GrpE
MDEIQDHTNEEVSLDQLQEELSQALSQAEENLSGWKRAQADLENFRKRKEAESAELLNFGKGAAFMQMLPVLDSLQQAMRHAPEVEDEKYNNWKSGLDGIVKQIESTLNEIGIQKIDAIGKKFDPNFHEAVKEVPGDEDGVIVEEYQTGYVLNGKLIRPSQVAITKKG